MTGVADSWYEANKRYLMRALARPRAAVEHYAERSGAGADEHPDPHARDTELEQELRDMQAAMQPPPALEILCAAFRLSAFERDLLLLCAGMELDSRLAAACAAAQSTLQHGYPTFGLALAALPDGHWSALSPAAPLRHWRLLEVGTERTLTSSMLRIDERILHYLAGVDYLDERLRGLLERLQTSDGMPESHRATAAQIARLWADSTQLPPPLVQLCGGDHAAKLGIAAASAAELGVSVYSVRASDIPANPAERDALRQLCDREGVLTGSVVLIDRQENPPQRDSVAAFVEGLHGPVAIASTEPPEYVQRASFRVDIDKPSANEQRELWRNVLGARADKLDGEIDQLLAQFNLDSRKIRAVGLEMQFEQPQGGAAGSEKLWQACRVQARTRLCELAQRIEPLARWRDLILPQAQLQTLHDIATHLKHRKRVYQDWGFAAKSTRGLGISALFAGTSGTGKTMAAEVLANDLQLDLYRIDLSQVVSKYIGETEKNLRRVFDAAEDAGALLLFDEADALFGKRSEVRDSHDRYANIEISYLLQRMEAYRGLAVLTTNMQEALDKAFMRRIRFIVQFPFPDADHRALIWERIFPADTPTEGLDVAQLAQLSVAGGNIRNIAMNAAFFAADAASAVRTEDVLRAARSEYLKLGKTISERELRGWR